MPNPPIAPREPFESRVHGHTRIDDYHWLRDKDSPRVRAHLEAENAYTKAVMAHTEAFQDGLYREMLARIQETDMDVLYRDGAYEYYSRTEQGKDYPILCRRPVGGRAREPGPGPVASEQITLDMNAMAQGHDYFALGAYEAGGDARLLAFSPMLHRASSTLAGDLEHDELR
jgi:oligopeptidase B